MLIWLERGRPRIDALVLEPNRCNPFREKWNKPLKEILPLRIGSTVEGKLQSSDPYGTDEGFWG